MKTNFLAFAALIFLLPNSAITQILNYETVTDDLLQEPPTEDWLSWRGTPKSWGYSPQDQINTSNVDQMQLVWSWALDDTGSAQAAPLVHNGVMFVPGPRGVIQALDAADGDLIWEYRPGITPSIDNTDREITAEDLGGAGMTTTTFAGVGRGVLKNIAIYGDKIYTATENASIRALDARTGRLAWETQTADPALGYFYTAGPIVADGVLVTGITGC